MFKSFVAMNIVLCVFSIGTERRAFFVEHVASGCYATRNSTSDLFECNDYYYNDFKYNDSFKVYNGVMECDEVNDFEAICAFKIVKDGKTLYIYGEDGEIH